MNLADQKATLVQRWITDFKAGRLDAAEECFRRSPKTRHVVDKMPKNLVHVGLIRVLWPQAKIVHCVRDYRDIAISCFARYFAKGQPFSWDLGELGEYCRDHARLCRHWHNVLGDHICAVRYEDLIADQEPATRKLIIPPAVPNEELLVA